METFDAAAPRPPRRLAWPKFRDVVRGPQPLLRRMESLCAARGLPLDVLRSALQVYAIRLVGAALTYAATIVLARSLGTREFGIYAYIFVVASLMGIAFSCGFNASALRFVASYWSAGRLRRLSGFLRRSFGATVLLSTVGAAAGIALVCAFRERVDPHYFLPALVGLASVPMWTLLNQLGATARAFGWVQVAYAPEYVLRPLLLVALFGALIAWGADADAVAALWAATIACAAAVLVQGGLVFRRLPPQVRGVRPVFHTRGWFAVSLGFFVIDGLRMLLDNADILLIGKLLDPHSVAVYFAVVRTTSFVAFISFSVMALAVPKFAEIHATGTRTELQRLVTQVIHLMFWPSLVAAGALALAGPFVLTLFGADFRAGYPALLVVLAGFMLRAALGPVEYLLNMTGHHRDTIRVYAVAAAADVVLNLLLIPMLGIVGAALASQLALLGASVVLCVLVRRRLGLEAFIHPVRVMKVS